MKTFAPYWAALTAAALVVAIWVALRDDGPERTWDDFRAENQRSRDDADTPETAVLPSMQRTPYDRREDIPNWIEGLGIAGGEQDRGGTEGVPAEVIEIAGLCFGKTPLSANTLEMKERILALIKMELSPEQKRSLVEYFRRSDDRAFKYHMMVAFRYIGDHHMLDAVSEYYPVDPNMVSECLQWIALRDKSAYGALSQLLEQEVEPLRRENLINRTAFHGHEEAEPILSGIFARGWGTPDRWVAIGALAKCGGDEGRLHLDAVINGDFEEAIYDVAGNQPTDENLRDLRCHAVIGRLMHGTRAEVDSLWGMVTSGEADGPVSDYVLHHLGVVRDNHLVNGVVELMLFRRVIPEGPLMYLEARATSEDLAQVAKLVSLADSPDLAQRLTNLRARLR